MTTALPPHLPVPRRRLPAVNVGIVTLVAVLAALLLSGLVQRLYRDEALIALEQRTITLLNSGDRTAAYPNTMPALGPGAGGRRMVGDVARPVPAARPSGAVEDGQLTLTTRTSASGVLRIAEPYAPVARRTRNTWGLIWAGALAAILLSLLAARQTHRALTRTLAQVGALIERERAFSEHAAHQLRASVAAMLLGLEAAVERSGGNLAAAVRTALHRGHRATASIDDLLALARGRLTPGVVEPHRLLEEVHDTWSAKAEAARRRLTVRIDAPLPPVIAARAAVLHILNVLVDNALAHGEGEVTLAAAAVADQIVFSVADEGRIAGPCARGGTGLALARALAEAEGAPFRLVSDDPTTFAVELPAGQPTSR
ncbi:sensor histidine kinase [Spirillospora sp. NPDC050679]